MRGDRAASGPRRAARAPALVSVGVAVLTVLSLVLVPAAAASGRAVDEPFWCAGTDVNADAPRVETDGSTEETVYWAPVLYKWDGGEWSRVVSANWSIATVGEEGRAVSPWADLYGHYRAATRRFTVYQPGYYAVQNVVAWQDRTYEASWVPYLREHGSCHFGSTGMQSVDDPELVAEPASVSTTERSGLEALLFSPATVVTALVVGALAQEGDVTGYNAPPVPSVTPSG